MVVSGEWTTAISKAVSKYHKIPSRHIREDSLIVDTQADKHIGMPLSVSMPIDHLNFIRT